MFPTKICPILNRTKKYRRFVTYPNLSMKNNDLNNPLPIRSADHDLVEQTIKHKKLHLKNSKKCCEIITIHHDALGGYAVSSCTALFLEFQGIVFGGTVLHLLHNDNKIHSCLLNLTDRSLTQHIQQQLTKWNRSWRNSVDRKLDQFIDQTPNLYKIDKLCEDPLTLDFLLFRRHYLQHCGPQHLQLLVPHFNLHAMPSVDFIPFLLPIELQKAIRENKNYYGLLDYAIDVEGMTYLTGFQNPMDSVAQEDYALIGKEISWRMTEGTSFINKDLSLSVCRVLTSNSYLVIFQGNTLEGSSGSPLYNSIGDIVGVNFGYFSDCISPEKEYRDNSQLWNFDVDLTYLEDIKQYYSLKNFNMALRLDSPLLLQWLNQLHLFAPGREFDIK